MRGIILDEENNYEVVARPFDRFFNYGEFETENFDFSSMKVQEKLDGSLMILYHYDNEWHVASKGSPDAGGNMGNENFTFSQLFWKIFTHQNDGVLKVLDESYTYCFELESKYNRIVVVQGDNEGKLTLIGVRHNKTGVSLDVQKFQELNPVREFPVQTVNDVIEMSKNLNPNEQEGFVLVDKYYNRLKIKSPKYVILHHLKDTLNEEKIVELIQKGETSEILTYFPDLERSFKNIHGLYENLIYHLSEQWEELTQMVFKTRKDFALVLQTPKYNLFKSAFFALYDGKVKNVEHWVRTHPPKKMFKLMKVRE